jgi:CubicO group peptidase (beta-lactamase class C family)
MVVVLLLVACEGGGDPAADEATAPYMEASVVAAPDGPEPGPSSTYALGDFPAFPDGALPSSTVAELQAALDAAVEHGALNGVTVGVVVADRGSWAGAAGTAGGIALTAESLTPTHSSGKTVVAAQILRLAEAGMLDLDDLASEHLPPELGFYDANGATIRQVLGMRSGIPGLKEFTAKGGFYPAERASSPVDVFRQLPEPKKRPPTPAGYASTNYVLLGTIIEHAAGRPLAEVLRSDVLSDSGLDGFVYTVEDALSADGYGVRATPGSLARWGYELYGGFVIYDASLRAMTDFGGEWYGLGVMDLSYQYTIRAVGHEGSSSAAQCCSLIRLVAFPQEGVVISVQADTPAASDPYGAYNGELVSLTKALLRTARG